MDQSKFTIARPAIENVGPIQFVRQSVDELKKVTWPTRSETLKLAGIVIVVSIIVGSYIGVLDFLFTKLMETIIR